MQSRLMRRCEAVREKNTSNCSEEVVMKNRKLVAVVVNAVDEVGASGCRPALACIRRTAPF
jgi:hypothetical protein